MGFRHLLVALFLALATPAPAGVHLEGRLSYLLQTKGPGPTSFTGSVRFTGAPSADQISRLEALGVEFRRHQGRLLGSRTVFPARIPFAALAGLKSQDFLVAVGCDWRPGLVRPLALSRPQVEADLAWATPSPLGGTLSGRGVVVGDFDTGINHLHSHFFAQDGGTFAWLDANGSGDFDAGDGVDLDADGSLGPGELLAYHEVLNTHLYGNLIGRYDLGFDMLFNDANGNLYRDRGLPDFGEDDPTYGERIFLVADANANHRLDPGEVLQGLGSSRIRAVLDFDGSVYRRGENLLAAPGDTWGHGTQVAGIVGGGWTAGDAMAGVAPGVEFLLANQEVEEMFNEVTAGLAWLVAEGADIVLIEFGSWFWEDLDGSTNFEIMMNEFAADQGVIFVTPAGNLAAGHMHCRFGSDRMQALSGTDSYHSLWVSFHWRDPVALGLTVTVPLGTPVALPLDGTTLIHQEHAIYSSLSVSPRGTRRLDLLLTGDPVEAGVGTPWVFQFTGPPTVIDGYFVDDNFGWGTGGRWQVGEETARTVTWPATADSGLVVGAYDPVDDGDIMYFSSRGPRIDGVPLLDLAAPGMRLYAPSPYNALDFSEFGGTSGAAPFAAGAAALLRELLPDLSAAGCRQILVAGAALDEHTTDPSLWGAGKLRIQAAIARLLTQVSDAPPHPELALGAFPNPANPSTVLSCELPAAGPAEVRVFDLRGREVWRQDLPAAAAGARSVRWPGRDSRDRPLPSGMYFAHVKQGRVAAACKVSLVK